MEVKKLFLNTKTINWKTTYRRALSHLDPETTSYRVDYVERMIRVVQICSGFGMPDSIVLAISIPIQRMVYWGVLDSILTSKLSKFKEFYNSFIYNQSEMQFWHIS